MKPLLSRFSLPVLAMAGLLIALLAEAAAALFACLVLILMQCAWYCATAKLDSPPPRSWLKALGLAWLLCFALAATSPTAISWLLEAYRALVAQPAWQLIGIALLAFLFIPLLCEGVRLAWERRLQSGLAAAAGFVAVMLLLYLPMGFDSIGQWESWVFSAYMEGLPSAAVANELSGRMWITLPMALAWILRPESFHGAHWLHWAQQLASLALLYAILRELKLTPLVAFMIAALTLVYPVNPMQQDLRSLIYNMLLLTSLAAVYLALRAHRQPTRWRLLQMTAALCLNIGFAELNYVLVAVMPMLWWLRPPRLRWRRLNLTLAFGALHAAKLLLLLLFGATGLAFYRADTFSSGLDLVGGLLSRASHILEIVFQVYKQTFWTSWRGTLAAHWQSDWLPQAFLVIAVIGAVAAILAARDKQAWPPRPALGRGVIWGALLILPAIGVLIWLDKYNQGMWRSFIFAPFGASIAVACLLLLAASIWRKRRARQAVFIALCLLLMFPASARLYEQGARSVSSADAKARILRQLMAAAPSWKGEAGLLLITDRSVYGLRDHGVSELSTNMFTSALYRLYQGAGPRYGLLCYKRYTCSADKIDSFDLRSLNDLSHVALFRLHDDLRVELLREIPPELAIANPESYNPDALIDVDAPLPRRAITMLGAAERD